MRPSLSQGSTAARFGASGGDSSSSGAPFGGGLDDTPDISDAGSDASGGMPVPMDALAVDGTPPAVGDSVEFTVAGTVSSLSGNFAIVTPATVNGQEVAASNGPPMSDEDRLQGMAAQADDDESDY